jgi:RNA 2',3'-cyclic 3'-phosphodiesterase
VSEIRAFVAIELPGHVTAALLRAGEAIRRAAPDWRGEKWVAEDNLHVTLKFLGTIDEATVSALRSSLTSSLAAQRPFEMRLGGVQGASSRGRHAMLWATFSDPDGQCTSLAETVVAAASTHGIETERRPFIPHVTLVRARKARRLSVEALTLANALLAEQDISMSVLSATLFASTLTPSGPVYERVDTWAFPQRR